MLAIGRDFVGTTGLNFKLEAASDVSSEGVEPVQSPGDVQRSASVSSLDSLIVKTPDALSPAEIAAWAAIRDENSALYSPYFHIGYTQILGRLRDNVRVIILRRCGKPVAFLPFQGGRFARPVGAPMTDYHGVIAPHNLEYDPAAMLAYAGVGALHFEALVDPQARLSGLGAPEMAQPCAAIRLKGGGPAWRETQSSSYRRHLKGLRRRIRKAETDFGARRFALSSNDAAMFSQLIDWKRAQYARTGKYDVLSAGWTETLLKDLLSAPKVSGGLRVDMHGVYFGDRLAAVDLGLTDGQTYHSWITAYDPDLRSVSPGMQLLEEIIENAQALGYIALDLGPGLDGYKHHYADEGFGAVRAGFAAISGPAAMLSRLYNAAETAGERSDLALGKLPGKFRRRYSQIAACDHSFTGRAKAMLSAAVTSGKRTE